MKTIFIPEQTKIKEQAEITADMFAQKLGFKKGSKDWQKAFENAVLERYMHSSTEGINKAENPHSPMLPDDVFKKFEAFSSNGVLGNQTQHGDFADNFRAFKGAVSILTTLYCYSVLRLTIEDFNLPKMENWSEEDKKKSILKVAGNIYARYLVTTAILAALEPVFNIKASQMNEVLLSMEIDKQPIEALRSKSERDRFLTQVSNYMRNFFGKESIFNQTK